VPLRLSAVVAGLVVASSASAQDEELRLMNEPGSFTDVADAFDDGDPFDLNVHVAFSRSRYAATLQREVAGAGVPTAGGSLLDVGDYEHVQNVLDLGLDLGVYRDVMLFARLPLVLSDERRILYPGGDTAAVDAAIAELDPASGNAVPLYYMPFVAPTRSGLKRFDFGLAFNVLNQARRPSFPTWMMLFETQLAIGDLMRPCDPDDDTGNGVVRDPDTGDIVTDAMGNATERSCSTGISQGYHAIRFESRLSKRFRYADVYGGIGYSFRWAGAAREQYEGAPADGSREGAGNLSGFLNRRPPMLGTFTAGVAVIPWEHRERWQRFSIDLRARATYVSEGRDYSPVYDALGSSQHRYLTELNREGVPMSPSDAGLRTVSFNGLTDVQAHGVFGGTLAIEMQAAKYIRFRFGTNLQYTTAHFLTYTDACNPNASPTDGDDPRAGRCIEGIIDPHHRTAIDLPGQRFRIDGGLTVDLFVHATAQF